MASVDDAPPLPAPRSGWRTRFGSLPTAAAAALAHAPENAAYGLIALAPLGSLFGPTAMALALLGTVVSNVVATLLGAGGLVNGPRAALSLLTAGFVAALLVQLEPAGLSSPWPVMGLLLAGLVIAGALQAAFGLMRLGTLAKYTPYPVRVGLSSGIGLLLVASALPVALGHGFGARWWRAMEPPLAAATVVGIVAFAVTWLAARRNSRWPPVLPGLAAAVAVQALLGLSPWAASLSRPIGVPTLPHELLPALLDGVPLVAGHLDRTLIGLLWSYALTVAVLCSLDTLLTGSVVDGRLKHNRDANRELIAQGAANVVTALAGGQPESPSLPRTASVMLGGAPGRHAALPYAATVLVLLLAVPGTFGWLPDSAIGGILFGQGLQMIAPTLWRTPMQLLADRSRGRPTGDHDRRQRRVLAENWGVCTAVAVTAVVLGLAQAVLVGATFAVLLFVRTNLRDVVRRSGSGEVRRSLKMRPGPVADALRQAGARMVVLELEGPLFFGTADALRVRLHRLAAEVDIVVLDLYQVADIDVTAARILFEIAEDWAAAGKRLVFAEWAADDPRRRVLETMAGAERPGVLHFADDTDLALEQAEDLQLQRLGLAAGSGRVLALADTAIARGLEARELALLQAELRTERFAAGAVLFRQGDPGDAIYISVAGEIGLRIPGSTRRLASFAPGVTLGEMAVLAHARRSAEAVAESDLTVLVLPVEAFDRLREQEPALAAKLLNNIALHLGDRVRVLTGDLAHWVSRAAAGRRQAQVIGEARRPGDVDAGD